MVGEAAGVYPCFVTTFRRGPKRCHMASGNHTKMPHAPPVMIVRNKCTPCEVRFLSFVTERLGPYVPCVVCVTC